MRNKTGFRKFFLFIVIAIVLSSSTAFADSIFLTGQGAPPNGYANDRNGGSHYTGFINGYFNNPSNTLEFVCIDFGTWINLNTLYNVNVSSFDSLTGVKFRDAFNNPLLTQYKEAAWLLYQMEAHPADTSAIQFAMWRIFKGEAVPYTQASVQWYNDALTNWSTLTAGQLSNVRVFTPTVGAQEIMAVVPLPAGVWLFGSGIAALIAVRRRKAIVERKGE